MELECTGGGTRITQPGMYPDGAGLYLQVTHQDARSWIFRYSLRGKAREMGLGSLVTFSLAEARERAKEARQLLTDGIDPIEAREARKAAALVVAAKGSETFSWCALAYIDAHRSGWRNAKHAEQWTNTLACYVEPICGPLPVAAINTAIVTRILEPIWTKKPETASRVRGRIEAVLDWATARGFRQGDNPARWRGHLDKLLPARGKVRRVKHHAALPYAELPGSMRELTQQEGEGARALEFLILLTAARPARWIGAPRRLRIIRRETLWKVPGSRTKSGREHRVPLSTAAMALLGDGRDPEAFIFGGAKGQGLSNMALLALLRRMGRDDLTAHGFRSTFRDWAAEQTNYPREAAEMALAHAVGDKVEAAYRRGDLFEKRRRLMDEWARYCGLPAGEAGSVIPIQRSEGR